MKKNWKTKTPPILLSSTRVEYSMICKEVRDCFRRNEEIWKDDFTLCYFLYFLSKKNMLNRCF